MEHYLLIRVLHALPGILLLLGVLAHAFMLWKAWRGGDTVSYTHLTLPTIYSV